MSDYEELIKSAKANNLKLKIKSNETGNLLSGEVLFHTPIISLAILLIAHSLKEGSFTSSDVSNWTGSILAQTFWGPKQANRKLEWSLILRKRCADALVFLESMSLIIVSEKDRAINLSDKGKDFCKKGLKREDDFGQLTRGIRRVTIDTEIKGFNLL